MGNIRPEVVYQNRFNQAQKKIFLPSWSATEHRLWVLARHLNSSSMQQQQQQQQQHQQQKKQQYCIPSFSAMKSLLTLKHHNVTKCAFTPIIPHPATGRDTIYTTMINFQDILKQKSLDYGPLWSDEGVYRIAKEIQLLQPGKFDNIFLGIGGFHLEKVIN